MESWLLFERASVIDGLGNDPMRNTGVLVRSNTIHSVGDGDELCADVVRETIVPRGDELNVIDASGKTVMPGLIDGHCHFTFGHPRSQEEMDLYTPMALRTLRSAWNL